MKSFKQFAAETTDKIKSPDEQNFADKHLVDVKDLPDDYKVPKPEKDAKKDKTKKADRTEKEDEEGDHVEESGRNRRHIRGRPQFVSIAHFSSAFQIAQDGGWQDGHFRRYCRA